MRKVVLALIAGMLWMRPELVTAGPTALDIYRFYANQQYEGILFDSRTRVTFYQDGLIQTLSLSSFSGAGRKEKVERSLVVTRNDDRISQTFTRKDTKLWDATYQISEDSVRIEYTYESQTADGTLRSRKGTGDQGPIYDYEFGKLHYEFVFSPTKNTITTSLKMGRNTYTVTSDKASGTPSVVCEGFDQVIFTFGRIRNEKYYIIYKHLNEPPLASYRVEGGVRGSSPLIAVLNFLIYNNLVDGPAIFPFIGGMPGT